MSGGIKPPKPIVGRRIGRPPKILRDMVRAPEPKPPPPPKKVKRAKRGPRRPDPMSTLGRPGNDIILATYLAQGKSRTLEHLREHMVEQGYDMPAMRTLQRTAERNKWKALAAQTDRQVDRRTHSKLVDQMARDAVKREKGFQTLAASALILAVEGLKEIDPKTLTAGGVRSLSEIAERAAKMCELLGGRATDRTETITRKKLDELQQGMLEEVNAKIESLEKHGTVH